MAAVWAASIALDSSQAAVLVVEAMPAVYAMSRAVLWLAVKAP
jgi:hypothetical protein